MPGALLHCPIRGVLTVPERAADGLTYTEEKRRIDCIRFLLNKGYPPSHFQIETVLHRFGHKGRNSFRTDLAVLDAPASSVDGDAEALLSRRRLIAEIKRDNDNAETAKKTQVLPAIDFLHDISAYGVYWDDIEQRLFYRTLDGTRTKTHETTIAVLPAWGQPLSTPRLTCADLRPTVGLQALFEKIEDRLHTQVADKSRRFEIMLQLLLAKLYDEHTHPSPNNIMILQDFSDAPLSDEDVIKVFKQTLESAILFYGKYLPKPVSTTFGLTGSLLRSISALLAPVKVLGSRRDVVQDFYMYFAKGVYKWDLAQYFTPSEVVDFIVSLVNPRAGDQVKDPACGSGDFLISSFHYAQKSGADLRDAVWGADNSENAVQVCVLNMVLNGDGKGNIAREDSLEKVNDKLDLYPVMLCNPPFGVRIQERRFDVLRRFAIGHEWRTENGALQPSDKVLKSQEVGLLFTELCVKQAIPGGRIGIILPNGYLGNRSLRYQGFREWLLRHTRLVAVVAFPRFTFKKSGADVSASVVVLEKRREPLRRAVDSEDYPFYAGVLESVGYSVSDKKAERIYKRDAETGVYLTNENNEPLIDADFDRALQDLWGSQVTNIFPWITKDIELAPNLPRGWSVRFAEVLARSDLSIDPKRWCERVATVREHITAIPHFYLGDIVDVVPESRIRPDNRALYQYVELGNTADGIVTPAMLRGWQLPQRARHTAQQGDIFVGAVWGSVGKWFLAGGECTNTLVSNGFQRLRLKPGKEEYLPDLLMGINLEAYRIQARAFSTGSDGLAELSAPDLLEIVLPRILDPEARSVMQQVAETLLSGRSTVASVVEALVKQGLVPHPQVQRRSTNWVQV